MNETRVGGGRFIHVIFDSSEIVKYTTPILNFKIPAEVHDRDIKRRVYKETMPKVVVLC